MVVTNICDKKKVLDDFVIYSDFIRRNGLCQQQGLV